jgi:hypothetical protein
MLSFYAIILVQFYSTTFSWYIFVIIAFLPMLLFNFGYFSRKRDRMLCFSQEMTESRPTLESAGELAATPSRHSPSLQSGLSPAHPAHGDLLTKIELLSRLVYCTPPMRNRVL